MHDGAPGAPITIKGPETGKDRSRRYRAVVYGTGRVFSIDNSYYTLDGFTIDGQDRLSESPYPTTIQAADAFKDSVRRKVQDGRLVYVGAADDSKDLTGITISNMFLNRRGRRVRPAAQQRPRQPHRRLGHPVLRHVRQGRRRRARRLPQR